MTCDNLPVAIFALTSHLCENYFVNIISRFVELKWECLRKRVEGNHRRWEWWWGKIWRKLIFDNLVAGEDEEGCHPWWSPQHWDKDCRWGRILVETSNFMIFHSLSFSFLSKIGGGLVLFSFSDIDQLWCSCPFNHIWFSILYLHLGINGIKITLDLISLLFVNFVI